ncbi:MAG TPA: BMP family ABC transporter substrate-binding protein [Acidimicrobiales bacterium]|nr:BMP family ABC transporter substrate-binding protein [Acidimicrobiales bacterium]
MRNRTRLGLIAMLVAALVAAACGDDGEQASTGTTCTQKPSDIKPLDFTGDGKFVIGVATPGPRNDGAYYQAVVDCAERLAKANNGSAIIVDNIGETDAATQIENLAKQNVDIMIVGASNIAKSLPELSKKYASTFWYCNCGAGQAPDPNYAQSQDDGTEINYAAGYATGLLMKAKSQTKAAFIGNSDANGFEVASFESFKLGLKAVDANYEATYYGTGSFDDVQKATEAYNTAKGQGIGAVVPFLGGAHEAIVKLANKDDIITMSAGSSAACTRSDLDYQIAVKFDGGDYLSALITKLLAGTYKEGDVYTFRVGADKEPGAQICDATTEQQTALDTVSSEIAAGKYKDALFAIQKKAYNF